VKGGPMTWQETPYTIPLAVAALTFVISAAHIWWRHRVTAAKTLSLIFLGGSGWMLGYALELAAVDLRMKVFWYRVELLSVVLVSIAWLVFTLQYTGREKWVNRRNLMGLCVIPVMTLLLVFTNEYHKLMWSRVEVSTEGLFVLAEFVHGQWFYIHTAYSYFLVLCGTFLLIQLFIRSQRLYRWQITALLLAAFVPLLHSVLNLFGVYTLVYPHATILLFPASSLAVAWIVFHFRVADIIPIAREAVIDGMSDSVIVLDRKHRIMDVNASAQGLIGHPASALIGHSIEDVLPCWPSQIEFIHGEREKEIVLDQKDSQHVFDVRTSPLMDWRGNLVSQVVVLRDITERKHAEDLLQESEEKFRTIFEHANDEIVYLDKHGVVIDINKKSEEIFGYKRKEIVGKNFAELEFLGSEYVDRVVRVFREVVTDGNPVPALFELEVEHKKGSKVFAEVNARLIKKNSEIEGILAIVRDITERKKAEKQIKQSLKEKEILLREIHHRVKNNLQVVSSLLSLQSRYVKNSHYKEMFKESQNRVRSMALIHGKLYQSKNLADINFAEYIKTLIRGLLHSYKVTRGNITLSIEIGEVSLGVDAAIPCGLIINELVSNSLKHAFPDGKGQITVKVRTVDGMTELIVSDTGIGIPDTIDFRNAETLGLRLVTILAEDQLDGTITLDTRNGTAFHIQFEGVK